MSAIPEKADVVVIGGGPAGSTAANLLAQKGYDVVLLDKVRHPRATVGESVLPHVWNYVDLVGATAEVERANFIQKSGGTAVWRGVIRQMAISDFGFTRPSLHVERDEFDEILLRAAERRGVRVLEEVHARTVQLDEAERGVAYIDRRSGGEDVGRIRCRYLIDASGQAALIANQLGFREFDKDLRFTSVWGYYANSAYIAQGGLICPWEERRRVKPTTVQLGIGDWGWCWHIVQKEHTSVGLVLSAAQAAEFKASARTLEERFDLACRRFPIVSELLEPASLIPGSVLAIRDFAYRPVQLAGDGWFLAGDAAAFVDPINSAGVITACYTGFAAASALDGCLRKPDRSAYFANLFSTLVRHRLALFRLSALPVGQNSYPEDIPIALKAAQLERISEQELLLAQTILTDRRENLAPLYAMDSRLKYGNTTKYHQIAELLPMKAGSQAVRLKDSVCRRA
jgi:flavin-dependent dehydrogenase